MNLGNKTNSALHKLSRRTIRTALPIFPSETDSDKYATVQFPCLMDQTSQSKAVVRVPK